MILKSQAVRSFLHFLGGLLLTAVVVPVFLGAVVLSSWTLAPIIDKASNQRAFDRAVWLASDGMETEDPRGYMLYDVEDFLDRRPTKAEVLELLGPPGDGYLEVSYYVGFQHSFLPIDPYSLELEFKDDRVDNYYLVQH